MVWHGVDMEKSQKSMFQQMVENNGHLPVLMDWY